MKRLLTAAILAASLGLAPAAQADKLLYRLPDGAGQPAPQAGTGGNQTAQILGGLAAIGALGYALNKFNEDDDDDDKRGHGFRRPDDRRGWDGGFDRRSGAALPGNCLRSIDSRYGVERVFGTDCLYRSGVNVSRLPRDCGTRVYAGGRERRAFEARCLAQNGWGVARHR